MKIKVTIIFDGPNVRIWRVGQWVHRYYKLSGTHEWEFDPEFELFTKCTIPSVKEEMRVPRSA